MNEFLRRGDTHTMLRKILRNFKEAEPPKGNAENQHDLKQNNAIFPAEKNALRKTADNSRAFEKLTMFPKISGCKKI
jgi:hypothetical protein